MIFSELYSAYYNAVAAVLSLAVKGERRPEALKEAIRKKAFGESLLTILPALYGERWQLLHQDGTTPLHHIPTMPLTELERRYLKSISADARVRLFDVTFPDLEGVEPLFTPRDYRIYDQYSDADPYEDDAYVARFRIILSAVKTKTPLIIESQSPRGRRIRARVIPDRLEYSVKDDKMRLFTHGKRYGTVFNLARITRACPDPSPDGDPSCPEPPTRTPRCVTLTVTDERNAMERVLLHFAHFEKQTERIDEAHYRVRILYEASDETELLIRILSFGPRVRVDAPDTFVRLVRERLLKQMRLGLR